MSDVVKTEGWGRLDRCGFAPWETSCRGRFGEMLIVNLVGDFGSRSLDFCGLPCVLASFGPLVFWCFAWEGEGGEEGHG